uniref:DegT/DnrJ/EryC1/StrS aminotransferase n=1 Tax=uncultured marine group II/III euryarchaeote KM3_146_G03 TaxID=1457881 RepID=A0A075GCM1_9EURY|nr:DegT/DnrJ/EryC1/StrS aminotransferase [uncultured marine group II/III euryarchaeote KM3_146_G03]
MLESVIRLTQVGNTHPRNSEGETLGDKIPLGRMFINDEMREVVSDVLDSGRWIKGPHSKAFGAEWAAYCGALAGTPCSNGSTALIAALRLLDVGYGDEVIVPSHTFIASATCIDQVGATPVFVDVEEEYHTLCPDEVEKAITDATKAIIAVHLYGQPISPRVFEIAKNHNIPLIEDSAQAHGAELNGQRIGSMGDLATFSFFPSKNMAVGGDGGSILANREDLADKISMAIDHGRLDKYRHDFLGSNFRLSEMQCAVGRVQLKHLDDWVARRNQIATRYNEAFSSLEWTNPPAIREGALHAWHQYVLRVDNRDEFQAHMDEKGVSTGIHYPIPCHLQPLYEGHTQHRQGALPVTEAICESVVSIPVHPHLSDDEAEQVISAVKSFQP